MNTFWLKIAGIAVVVIGVIVLISVFPGSEAEPEAEPSPKPKTFYDVVEKDKERFQTKPKPADSAEQEPQQQVVDEQAPAEIPAAKPIKIYCRELSEIEKIEAERLLNVAVPGRSIGRLPMTGFNLMVDSCRQIIRRWPDSWYAYRAKQMLVDMPERFRSRHRVTEEELDLSKFAKPRPGTKPFIIKETQ